MKFARHILVVAVTFLGGCTHSSVPRGYGGKLADITESFQRVSGSTAHFFVVEEINGKKIENSIGQSQNHGWLLSTSDQAYQVPAEKLKIKLRAYTLRAAPILAVLPGDFELIGEIDFTPEPNGHYAVAGKLTEQYEAIWIQEKETQKIVSEIVDSADSEDLRKQFREELLRENGRTSQNLEGKRDAQLTRLLQFEDHFRKTGGCRLSVESSADVDSGYELALSFFRQKKYEVAGACFEYLSASPRLDRRSMRQLGIMYELGYGFDKNKDQAVEWYRKSGAAIQ